MKKVLILATALISQSILASAFNGVWTGHGEGETPKSSFKCSNVEMRVLVEGDKFTLRGGHYNCEGLSAEYPYSVFTIEKGKLMQNGLSVGSIDEQTILLKSPKDGFEMTLNLYKGKLFFNEAWVDGEDYLVIGAELSKNK